MDALFSYMGQQVCSMLRHGGSMELASDSCVRPGGFAGVGQAALLALIAALIGLSLLISLTRRRASELS